MRMEEAVLRTGRRDRGRRRKEGKIAALWQVGQIGDIRHIRSRAANIGVVFVQPRYLILSAYLPPK
jgi:hypothetical protein